MTNVPTTSPSLSPTRDLSQSYILQFPSFMTFLCVTTIIGALVQGLAPRKLLKAIPHPILIMILYMFFGIIIRFTIPNDEIDLSIRFYISPVAIQTLFLPILIFSELFRMNTRAFFIVFNQLMLLVGPGVLLGTAIIALFSLYIMPSEPKFDFNLSMAFGAMLSTTDPIAIIICINELAAPKRLATVVGGESILNDGASIVLVTLFLGLNAGATVSAESLVFFIFNQLLFSVLFGILMGIVTVLMIKLVRDDGNTMCTICLIMPFFTFTVATYYFQNSGVLAITPLGVILNEFGRGLMIGHVETVERLFDQLSFIVTTWLYALSGYVVGVVIASEEISAMDWGSLFVLYIWINVARFLMVFVSYPILKHSGYGFSFRELVLLAWGGLRGAVGLTLALFISLDPSISLRQGSLIQFFMCGCIMLMIFNGVTAPLVLKWLKLDSKPNAQLLDALYQKMSERVVVVMENAGTNRATARWLAYGSASKALQVSRRRRLSTANYSEHSEHDVPLTSKISQEEAIRIHLLTNHAVHWAILVEQRRHLVLSQRHIFQKLLGRELLSREGWYMLDRAADRQLEVNQLEMDQFKFLVKRVEGRVRTSAKLSRSFFTSNSGLLLKFLLGGGKDSLADLFENVEPRSPTRQDTANTPALSEDDDDEDEGWIPEGIQQNRSGNQLRTLGITLSAQDWCFHFLVASWGFLFAQQHSTHVVNDMFTVTPGLVAFEEERRALHAEIAQTSLLPAQFINAVGTYAPEVMQRFKRLHVLSETKNQLFGAVSELSNHGVIERTDLKKLLKFAERSLLRVKKHRFLLVQPISIGDRGEQLAMSPNFFPFRSHVREVQAKLQKQKEAREEMLKINRQVVPKKRRHSFGDFDAQNHVLRCVIYFEEEERIKKEEEATWEQAATAAPMTDMSKMMETLRLDDTELKRF